MPTTSAVYKAMQVFKAVLKGGAFLMKKFVDRR